MAGAGSKRLELELTARDMTGKAFGTATGNLREYSRNTKNGFKQMSDAAMSYTKLVGSIVTAKVLSRGFAYLEQGIHDVAMNIVDMDQALTAASAKFGPSVHKGTQAFAEMKDLVVDISATTEYTASETGSALDFLAMAGFQHAQAMKALRPLTDLATASQMDFARASDIASDALGAFNMSMEADQIEGNLNRINDVFAKTVTTSNTTMETLFDTMKLAGPVVRGGVEMFGTLAGTLGSAGIKGTIAATTVKNMFLRLQAPPAEAGKSLRKLKIQIDDGNGSMKDMITIIGELNTALAGKNEIQREKFLKDIFGMRAIAGVNVLLRKGEEGLRAYHKQLSNSQGAAKEMADTMRTGLGTQLKVLQSTLMAKGFDIFNQLMGKEDPVEAIKELIDVVREFDVGPIVSHLRDLGSWIKSTTKYLWENRELIQGILKLWIGFNIASKLASMASGIRNVAGALGAFGGGQGLAGATLTATTSIGGLTKAVGLARAGVAAFNPVAASLVAGLSAGYLLWKKMEAEQNRKIERENALIKKYRGASKLTGEQARKEAEIIRSEFAGRQTPGQRAKFRNVMQGNIAEERLKEIYGGEDLRKMEYYYALQRRLGRERTAGVGWEDVTGWKEQRKRLDRLSGSYQKGGKSEYFPWMDRAPEATSNPEMSTGRIWEGMPKIQWELPETKVNIVMNNVPEGVTATAEVVQAPPLTDQALGAANG